MRIKLKETQKTLLSKIASDKQTLQTEFQRLIQRENEIVAVICESSDVVPVEGMKIEGDEIVFPEQEEIKEVDKKLKKLNAK